MLVQGRVYRLKSNAVIVVHGTHWDRDCPWLISLGNVEADVPNQLCHAASSLEGCERVVHIFLVTYTELAFLHSRSNIDAFYYLQSRDSKIAA